MMLFPILQIPMSQFNTGGTRKKWQRTKLHLQHQLGSMAGVWAWLMRKPFFLRRAKPFALVLWFSHLVLSSGSLIWFSHLVLLSSHKLWIQNYDDSAVWAPTHRTRPKIRWPYGTALLFSLSLSAPPCLPPSLSPSLSLFLSVPYDLFSLDMNESQHNLFAYLRIQLPVRLDLHHAPFLSSFSRFWNYYNYFALVPHFTENVLPWLQICEKPPKNRSHTFSMFPLHCTNAFTHTRKHTHTHTLTFSQKCILFTEGQYILFGNTFHREL